MKTALLLVVLLSVGCGKMGPEDFLVGDINDDGALGDPSGEASTEAECEAGI